MKRLVVVLWFEYISEVTTLPSTSKKIYESNISNKSNSCDLSTLGG